MGSLDFFKVAVQNFSATVFDTDDLSITRGTSLTALELPKALTAYLNATFPHLHFDWLQASASELFFGCGTQGDEPTSLQPKTMSAPKGIKPKLFKREMQAAANELKKSSTFGEPQIRDAAREIAERHGIVGQEDPMTAHLIKIMGQQAQGQLTGLSNDQIKEIRDSIIQFASSQQGEWPFDLLTISVASAKGSGRSVGEVLADLETELSVQQLQTLSVRTLPPQDCVITRSEEAICAYTGTEIALRDELEKGKRISRSALRRRKLGRTQKSKFYATVLEADPRVTEFASDFHEIVEAPPSGLPESLKSKIAIVHMDGNGFGKLRASVQDFEEYKTLSEHLDGLKKNLLAKIIDWIAETPGMMHKDAARFETLIWGGDEFMFVLPAWHGWKFAAMLLDAVSDWKAPDGKALSFSFGMVFASNKAPIVDLKNAADTLSVMAKGDRSSSRLQVIAYEGIDRVHLSPSLFRQSWLTGVKASDWDEMHAALSIAGEDVGQYPSMLEKLNQAVSRSAMHKYYFEYAPSFAMADTKTVELRSDIERLSSDISKAELDACLEWLFEGKFPLLKFAQLALLSDYITPLEEAS